MTTVSIDDSRLHFIPLDKVTQPINGIVYCYKDHYWIYCPERGILFFRRDRKDQGSPQCNTNELITNSIRDRMYPWAKVKLVPLVFIRIDPRDYC